MSSVADVRPVVAARTDEGGARIPGESLRSALPGVAARVAGSLAVVPMAVVDAGSSARAELVPPLFPSAVQ